MAIDSNPAAIESYNANNLEKVGYLGDILDLSADEIAQSVMSRWPGVKPRGVIGGPPCQGFSNGNVVKDQRDPRNRLPFAYAALLTELNKIYDLDFFVFENVTGLLRKQHRNRLNKIRASFRGAGFRLFEAEINAVWFGVPQIRNRLFIVGLNATRFPDLHFGFPDGSKNVRTVAEVLKGLPPPVYFRRILTPQNIPFHENHWTMQPKSMRFATGNFNRWRSFRRLSWDSPSPTVAYGNREIHIHPDGRRRLSIFEAMILQGFPPNYVLRGNFSDQVTQVSNAVPPPVASSLATRLLSIIEKAPPNKGPIVARSHWQKQGGSP